MSLKPLLSFSAGEIDPILHDRTTLEKFRTGLETARGVMIGKTGTILSRFSRAHFLTAKNNNEKIRIHSPQNSGLLLELGLDYCRVYNFSGTLQFEAAYSDVGLIAASEEELESAHFDSKGDYIFVFMEGRRAVLIKYKDDTGTGYTGFVNPSSYFAVPSTPSSVTYSFTANGYPVEYAFTIVVNGEEGDPFELVGESPPLQLPVAANEFCDFVIKFNGFAPADKSYHVRVYRRPEDGGAFGFIAESYDFTYDGGLQEYTFNFSDLGVGADFTNNPPRPVADLGFNGLGPSSLNPSTGVIYQGRLLQNSDFEPEAIIASRPQYLNNYYRDYPYGIDSSLLFKSGASGNSKILRMVEADGLIVFTTTGVFTNTGLLSINNLALQKRGNWVINVNVPPLVVPGGVFFVEKDTNAVRQLIFSDAIGAYQTIEHSIFSNHLFRGREIVSWCFQDGNNPVIKVVFSDGKWAMFTYQFEHQMRAWTRQDSIYPIEYVEGTGIADTSFYVINKNGQRYISVSLPRFVPSSTAISDPESDKLALNSFMDDLKTTKNLINDNLTGADVFTLTPVTSGVWDGPLTLTCGTSALFPDPGLGEVGTKFRFFDTTDQTIVDLEVTARASDNSVTVSPSSEFPSAQASGFNLYEILTTITGLDHLEGESVAVFVDGYVAASPNNDQNTTNTYTVSSGSITLQEDDRGAIVVVGRPIVADIKTLNITTVAQSPTTIESLTVNKLYLKIKETRGLYVANRFPEESSGEVDGSSVLNMENQDYHDVDEALEVIGNRYKEPSTRRQEVIVTGEYDNNGKIAIRQVDPVHFEIVSIIPDVEVLQRRN